MQHAVLDLIVLKDGRKFHGIVDYVSTKQIYFFDFTTEVNIDFIIMAILWRGNAGNVRFSVFNAIEYPNLPLPRAILIPLNNIEESSVKLVKSKKPKQRRQFVEV